MTSDLTTLILAENVPLALAKIRDSIEAFDEDKLTGKFTSQRPFKVATQELSLEGWRFSDIMVVGRVDQKLIDNAKARLV